MGLCCGLSLGLEYIFLGVYRLISSFNHVSIPLIALIQTGPLLSTTIILFQNCHLTLSYSSLCILLFCHLPLGQKLHENQGLIFVALLHGKQAYLGLTINPAG